MTILLRISVHLEVLWQERQTEKTSFLPGHRREQSQEENVQEETAEELEAKEEEKMCQEVV